MSVIVVEGSFSFSSIALTSEYHSSYGLMIHCTPDSSNLVLLSLKAIFEVVSGVLLIQTNIFMLLFLKASKITDKLQETRDKIQATTFEHRATSGKVTSH